MSNNKTKTKSAVLPTSLMSFFLKASLSENQHLISVYSLSFYPAAWAQEKAKSLGIHDLSSSHIEKLSGDNTRGEKERVMAALKTG